MPYKLLIVDDETANLRLLERLFQDDYLCLTAPSAAEAMKLLDLHDVAVIISDQRMPHMTGLELLKQSADRRPHMVRILLTGYTDPEALVEAINCGLVYMYVSKPWNNDDLKLCVARAVEHYKNNKLHYSLAAENERLNVRIEEMKLDFVMALTRLMHSRDPLLFSHAARVNQYASRLGERLGLSNQSISDMEAASFLHDVGAEVMACVAELRDVADIIRYQSENFDGSGRPLGLIGEQIPLTARILRVTKSFDLLTSPRHEEQAHSHERAIERLRHGSGKEFDPVLVQEFSDLATELTAPIPVATSEIQQLRTS